MASHPPGACCSNLGPLHEGTPKGRFIKSADGKVDCYLAEASGDKAKKDTAILYLFDAFGIGHNSKLMADGFAAAGYTTLVPDLFEGDAMPNPRPEGFDIMAWITSGTDGKSPHTKEAVDPITVNGIETLRSLGFKKIGAVGYCFGAKYLVRHFKDGIDVGYCAHPSFVDDEELAAITGPLSISAAEIDPIFPAEKRHKSEEILIKTKQPWQINLFSNVEHGFSVRGDPKVKAEKYAKEQAFKQAVDWFDEHLSSTS